MRCKRMIQKTTTFLQSNVVYIKKNIAITDSKEKWLSWGCKVEVQFHLSEPLFSPLSCLSTCWTEISLQFSLETTLMSHTHLAHQYFTSKPNLLRMTTYHRQDMSFTAATFTFHVFSIFAEPQGDIHGHTHAHVLCMHIYFGLYCLTSSFFKQPL